MLRTTIRGVCPLILHNGQLADPQNEWSREMASFTSKKKKLDSDRDEIGRIEFMGSLYVGDDGAPCLPGENFESMLQAEGARNKIKRQVQCGVICDGNFKLVYDGPQDAEGLWSKRDDFAFRKAARNQRGRVIRVRPIFRAWSVTFDLEVFQEEINKTQVADLIKAAGRHTGLGDWRPKFGRFVVESMKEVTR